jgi:hypothetical protein
MVLINLAPMNPRSIRRLAREGARLRAAVHEMLKPLTRIDSEMWTRRVR